MAAEESGGDVVWWSTDDAVALAQIARHLTTRYAAHQATALRSLCTTAR
jgi:hypothetical protein